MPTRPVIIERTQKPDTSAPHHHDHPQPARHRPLQVHDDAGGAAPLSGCAGGVPLQVPQPRHRPGAVRRRRSAKRCAHLCSLQFQDAELALPALDALHQERLRRLPRAVPASTRSTSTIIPQALGRARHPHRGPWLHTILFEIPVLAIVNEVYFRNTQPRPDLAEGRRRLETKIAQLQGEGLSELKIADYGTRRRFSKDWHEEVLRTLSGRLGAGDARRRSAAACQAAAVRRHQQRAVRHEARPDPAGHHGARVPAGLPGARPAAARQPGVRLRDRGRASTAATSASRCRTSTA